MLWLASYPRSGNTFLRVILSQVYGIESSEFHDPRLQTDDRAYLDYSVVKTHLLPDQLVPDDHSVPAVYVVRDGRDALVSNAWYHCDFVAPGAGFRSTLLRAILAVNGKRGSHFGGWSRHVRLWQKRAALVLRFEDLIADPITTAERIRAVYPLPAPRADRLPSFGELRSQKFKFGTGAEVMDSSRFRERFFRRGKVGGWRDEMPLAEQLLFYTLHGWTLWKTGYLQTAGTEPVQRNRDAVIVQARLPARTRCAKISSTTRRNVSPCMPVPAQEPVSGVEERSASPTSTSG